MAQSIQLDGKPLHYLVVVGFLPVNENGKKITFAGSDGLSRSSPNIDRIGTGFSRSLVPADETKKQFYSTDNDIHSLLSKTVQNRFLQSEIE